jgi:hypothetical protein
MLTPQTTHEFFMKYGHFLYQEAGGGRILITDDWEDRNLIVVDLDLVGKHTVHKAIAGDFKNIFHELKLLELPTTRPAFRGPIHWDGCFVPRHKSWNPKRNLSIHSWACAVDLNAAENPMGVKGKMDPRIVEVFERYGWTWGGRWKGRSIDPMHFQACATLPGI